MQSIRTDFLLLVVVFGLHHHDCVVPQVANSLCSGPASKVPCAGWGVKLYSTPEWSVLAICGFSDRLRRLHPEHLRSHQQSLLVHRRHRSPNLKLEICFCVDISL